MGILGAIFLISLLTNLYLLILVKAQMGKTFSTGVVREGSNNQVVALYDVEGVIDSEAADRFEEFSRNVLNDWDVKAVLIRVESPGGSVTASDRIHQLISELKTQGKKVVVSMGGVAASGGYYISAPADEIMAEPTTITGSIGVIMGWLVLEGTLDKIGMEAVVIKSSHADAWKDEISSFQTPDERQRVHLQQILDKIQDRFEHIVKEGRAGKLRTKNVRYAKRIGEGEDAKTIQLTETEPLNGKVYMADEAKNLGLVDSIGYLPEAIDRVAELASLENPKVVRYTARRGLFFKLMESEGKLGFGLNAKEIEELQTPKIMMIWKAQ